MLKKFLCLFISVLTLLCPTSVFAAAGAPSVSAQSAVLMSIEDGTVIFEKCSHKKLPMASTTKIMTCLVALERGNLSDVVKIAPEAIGVEGTSLYLQKGDSCSLLDLLYAVMLRSANDAAAAVAYHIGGTIENFSDMMNEKAAELGLKDTHFMNPHGLHHSEHYTTAYDFALLASYAMKNEEFAKIVSSKEHTVSLNDGSLKKPIVNHNRLLRTYDGACGVKTGFTKTSGRCLVSSAERNGVILVAVTFNAPSDWADHKNMLDYGFSQYCRKTIMEKGAFEREFPIAGGSCLTARNTEAVTLTLKKDSEITVRIEGNRLIFPPVYEGQILGYAVVSIDGKEYKKIPLAATGTVEEEKETSFSERLFEKLKSLKNN